MSKKLLIVNGSPRKNGVDAAIAKLIADHVKEQGYETEIVNICEMKIGGCRACMACKKTQRCVQKDCMNDILDKIRESDMLLFATPVYFLSETGPFRTFMDRMYPLMLMNPDRTVTSFIGNVKKAAIIVTCGAPDGNMKFANIVAKFINVMKMYNVTDASGFIIPGANPDTVMESPFTKDCLDGLSFQFEM